MLTENQSAALDYRRHLSVTANAGAGKTTVLVQRFIEIVLHTDTRVGEVAAITFTEKAASELKKKIADHLEQKISQETTTAGLIAMERIRDQLVAANIGTIHSFCAQLLREFPVEAVVDASFVILEGIDRQLLEMETFRETLESLLTVDDGSGRKEKLVNLLRMLGRETVERYLRIFIQKRDQIDRMVQGDLLNFRDRDAEEIRAGWKLAFEETILRKLGESDWIKWTTKILDGSGNKDSDAVKSLIAKWSQSGTAEQKIQIYRDIHDLLFTAKGTVRKKILGKAGDDTGCVEITMQLEQFASSVSRLLEGSGEDATRGDRILLSVLRILLDLYTQVVDRYDKKKLDHGYLDFDDILSKTSGLMSHPSIAPVIINKFKYVMVDEFQDTNHLQYEIVQKLVQQFDHGNLFIVGDPKQSIYGFRDAEVAVFEDVRRSIAAHANGKDLTLAESFRPLPNLIDFVNRIFSDLMEGGTTQFDVGYNPLVQGRQNEKEGVVDLLLVPTDDPAPGDAVKNGSDLLKEECIMIAERIRRMISDGNTIFTGKEEHPRPVRYSDIAILVRQRTHVRMLERVLAEYKIPALLSGGIGFFQTQEVQDFLNYFKFLLNSDDDVALAGILRSPFFVVSDQELFTIARCEGKSMWDKVVWYTESVSKSNAVHHAISVLKNHRKITDRVSIPSLIQSIYVETGWQGTMINLPMGEQYIANAEKLLQIARTFENQGFSTLYDFIQRLQMLVEYADREGQAPLDLKGNSVQVMTIHAAKGLEFPVVILPFIHEPFHYDDSPYVDSGLGIALNVNDENNFEKKIIPSFVYLLKERNRQKTEAEEKRIFYVACTRARDGLILSGQRKLDGSTPSYLKWIESSLSIVLKNSESCQVTFPTSALKVLRRNGDRNAISELQHPLTITLQYGIQGMEEITTLPVEPVSLYSPEKINLKTLRCPARGEIFSATQMKTFSDCPRKYYLKFILGIPEVVRVPVQYHEEDEPDDVLRGELEGSLAHAVLQSLSGLTVDEDAIRKRIIEVKRTKGMFDSEEKSDAIETLVNTIKNFSSSVFGQRVLGAGEYFAEQTISVAFDTNFLTGTIDRMFKSENGDWSILDYKTDNIPSSKIKERAQSYKSQLLFYALLVSRLYDQKVVEGTIVFLRHPSLPVQYSISEHELSVFKSELKQWIDSITQRHFDKNKSHCRFCSYYKEKSCISDKNL